MIGNLLVSIVEFFYGRKLLFFMLLVAFFAVFGFGISKLTVSENIFSALPKGKSFEQFNKLIESKSITSQVVFSVAVGDSDDTDHNELATAFADSLIKDASQYFADITAIRPEVEEEVYDYFYSNFPALIDSGYYHEIDNKLKAGSIQSSLNSSYNQLVSPGSSFLKNYILNDPLYITGEFFKGLGKNSQGIIVEDGVVLSKDRKQILITAKTKFDSHNSALNVECYRHLGAFKEKWNAGHPNHEFDYFGTFVIAAENAIQIKKDALLTVCISLVLILLILFIYYRKFLIAFYFVLPSVFGGTFALGIMGFIKPEVSGLSMATGAVLLGIILDYSFHFLTHLRHTRSVSLTVKEIAMPLFTGSFTSVTAFAALMFTNSAVLRDFGLFTALSLSAAGIFTLTGLPVILKIFKFDYKNLPGENAFKIPAVSQKFRNWCMFIIIVLTVIFLKSSGGIQFDTDLENLSYHREALKNKEQELTGINPKFEKKIYLFASGTDFEKTCEHNFKLYEKVNALKQGGTIQSFLSAAPFLIPQKIKEQRELRWKNYWQNKKSSVVAATSITADSLGFKSSAFNDFFNWIERGEDGSSSSRDEVIAQSELMHKMGLDNLIDQQKNKTTLITTVVVSTENLNLVKAELRKIEGVELFDRSEVATSLLQLIREDLNYIVIVSSLLVFFTLLLIYGRIELTILAFLPMAVSWIWIIGIAALLHIKFNFVNVVIATFIFGLGDDYSIFVTDGLLHKYKYRKNTLSSYQSAILLSAFTTLIGTGVLIFAKHPALNSVSVISVLGIACILIISFLFQPFLFDFFVQKRIDKKRAPVSIVSLLFTIFEFPWFVTGCLILLVITCLLKIIPAPQNLKVKILNSLISFFAGSVIYTGVHVKKKIIGKENLDFKKPSIIIANHTSFLDILLTIMLNGKVIIMVKDWVYHSPLMGFFIRYAGYVYTESGAEANIETIRQRIAQGYSIVVFPEGTRSVDGVIGRFHKGAFWLANELQLDITPILIHGASYVLPKNDFLVKKGDLNLKILPRIKAGDARWGTTYQERTKSIAKYFKAEHQKFKDECETAKALRHRIFNNYIFKGPVLEWYVKIKWMLEGKNYDCYNLLVGDKTKITDVGCGYGYLPLFLHYKNNQRKIVGLDYDTEKIEIAKNCYDKDENLVFEVADITNYSLEKTDVIFLNDVLHYFTEIQQQIVLQRCYDALNESGIFIIRDGITDLTTRHRKTKFTEFLSTKIFSFNKKQNTLHFFSSAFIEKFAIENNLSFEMKEHSSSTSNVLFILKKNADTQE